jgi:hypothetical protein
MGGWVGPSAGLEVLNGRLGGAQCRAGGFEWEAGWGPVPGWRFWRGGWVGPSAGLEVLEERLGGAQCRAGCFGGEENFLATLAFEPTTVQRVAYLLY